MATSLPRRISLIERQRGPVDAPPLAGGCRTVAEDVPQVTAAGGAACLAAREQQLEVGADHDSIAGRGVRESAQAETPVAVGPDGEAVGKSSGGEPLRAQQRPAPVRAAAPKSEPATPASV